MSVYKRSNTKKINRNGKVVVVEETEASFSKKIHVPCMVRNSNVRKEVYVDHFISTITFRASHALRRTAYRYELTLDNGFAEFRIRDESSYSSDFLFRMSVRLSDGKVVQRTDRRKSGSVPVDDAK